MGKGFHHTVTLVLDCRHVIDIATPAPQIGESQYCRKCGDYRTVDDAPPSYSAVCQTGKCTLSRSTRADREAALTVARKHVGKMTRHRVTVFNGMRTIAEVTNVEETLFVTAEERSVIVAEGQAMLKNLGYGGTAAA